MTKSTRSSKWPLDLQFTLVQSRMLQALAATVPHPARDAVIAALCFANSEGGNYSMHILEQQTRRSCPGDWARHGHACFTCLSANLQLPTFVTNICSVNLGP